MISFPYHMQLTELPSVGTVIKAYMHNAVYEHTVAESDTLASVNREFECWQLKAEGIDEFGVNKVCEPTGDNWPWTGEQRKEYGRLFKRYEQVKSMDEKEKGGCNRRKALTGWMVIGVAFLLGLACGVLFF